MKEIRESAIRITEICKESLHSKKEKFHQKIQPNIESHHKNWHCDVDLEIFEKSEKKILDEDSAITEPSTSEMDDGNEIKANSSSASSVDLDDSKE